MLWSASAWIRMHLSGARASRRRNSNSTWDRCECSCQVLLDRTVQPVESPEEPAPGRQFHLGEERPPGLNWMRCARIYYGGSASGRQCGPVASHHSSGGQHMRHRIIPRARATTTTGRRIMLWSNHRWRCRMGGSPWSRTRSSRVPVGSPPSPFDGGDLLHSRRSCHLRLL